MALIKDENISKAQNYFLGYLDAKKEMQEKINKALDEIENYIVEDTCEDGVLFAYEMLKRNLGCDKDA